jgi:AcrR family transcriptional regulator
MELGCRDIELFSSLSDDMCMGRPKNFSREEVLEKAMPVLWKHGFADTSLQELERATGVNKSGLYTEFRDKEDLFVAWLRHYLESQGKRGLLTKEPLGWKNVETFLKNGPLTRVSSRDVFPSTPCGSSLFFRMKLMGSSRRIGCYCSAFSP